VALSSLELVGGSVFIAAKLFSGFILAFFAPHVKKYVILTCILESAIWTSWMFARKDAWTPFFFGFDQMTFTGLATVVVVKHFVFGMTDIPITYFEAVFTGLAYYFLLMLAAMLVNYSLHLFLIWRLRLKKRSGICLTHKMFVE